MAVIIVPPKEFSHIRQTRMIDEIIKRLSHKIWELFDKSESPIQNNTEGNWSAAENIIRRVINGTYALDEFRSFFTEEDARWLKERHDEYIRAQDNG